MSSGMSSGQQHMAQSSGGHSGGGGPFDYSSILSSSSGLGRHAASNQQQGSQYLSSILGSSNTQSSLPLDMGQSSFGNVGSLGGIRNMGNMNMSGSLNLMGGSSNTLPLSELMNMPNFASSASLSPLHPGGGHPLAPGLASGAPQGTGFGAAGGRLGSVGQGVQPAGSGAPIGAGGALDTTGAGGGDSNPNPNPGIDGDILPDGAFPSVSWLRQYKMHMYRWAGDSKEWTEYAMHLPRELMVVVLGADHKAGLAEVTRLSRCDVWVDEELLGGSKEKFIVFLRGSSGQPSNVAMGEAIELISEIMRRWVNSTGGIISANVGLNSPMKLSSDLDPSSIGSSMFNLSAAAMGSGSSSSQEAMGSLAAPLSIDSKFSRMKDRPELSKVTAVPGSAGYVQRSLEIPRDVVGLIIGQSGKKIKELCQDSGAKIQFKVNKTAEREGRPGILEVQGSAENVDKGLQLIWDLLQSAEKEKEKI